MEDYEKLYTPSRWCSHRCNSETVVAEHIKTVTEESLEVTKKNEFIENIRYGENPNQLLDLFEPSNMSQNSPTFIFIHGGYWQELNKGISRYCIKPLIQANIRVIVPGYDLAPNATLRTIMREIKDLGKFVSKLAKEKQWKNIWYCGHSAGAHLASSLLCSEIISTLNITGMILISGIYNLEPLIHTTINDKLNITGENYQSLSPLFQLSPDINKNLRVLIIVAEFDSPAFHNQSKIFREKMKNLNFEVDMKIIHGADHFTVVENLKNDDFVLTKIIIENILESNSKQ